MAQLIKSFSLIKIKNQYFVIIKIHLLCKLFILEIKFCDF